MKMTARVYRGVAAGAVLLVGTLAYSQGTRAGSDPPTHVIVRADAVNFQPIEIPGFDSGVKIAAIYGNPNAEAGEYVIRLAFPDGYRFPAHWHPNAENLTVLQGEFMLGMGDTADASKLVTYAPGTFMYVPGKMPHFGAVKGATVVQLHGQAPFKIELAKPSASR